MYKIPYQSVYTPDYVGAVYNPRLPTQLDTCNVLYYNISTCPACCRGTPSPRESNMKYPKELAARIREEFPERADLHVGVEEGVHWIHRSLSDLASSADVLPAQALALLNSGEMGVTELKKLYERKIRLDSLARDCADFLRTAA